MTEYRTVQSHRCYRVGADHAEVARYLREQAATGFLRGIEQTSMLYRHRCTCGVNLPEYPNSISLMLTRDAVPGEPTGWHLSVCCVDETGYRGYQASEGEHWAELIFGPYRTSRVVLFAPSNVGQAKDVHHFRLDCDWANTSDPAVTLEGVD